MLTPGIVMWPELGEIPAQFDKGVRLADVLHLNPQGCCNVQTIHIVWYQMNNEQTFKQECALKLTY